MGFGDAVKSVFGQYVGFSGRARRSEYWFFALFSLIVSIVLTVVDVVLNTGFLSLIFALAVFLPSLAVGVRRLHDTGKSGWWLLIGLIPVIGGIVLLVFFVQDSQPQPNAHGPSPKGVIAGAGGGYAPPATY